MLLPEACPADRWDALHAILSQDGPLHLVGGTASEALAPELRQLLLAMVATLQHGEAVALTPHEAMLTTQEAAAVLGVSRPTVVRLLESGALPFEQPGKHRRVRLSDVIAYRDRRDHL